MKDENKFNASDLLSCAPKWLIKVMASLFLIYSVFHFTDFGLIDMGKKFIENRQAREKHELIILTENFPPYSYQEDSALIGIIADLLREIIKNMDSRLSMENIKVYNWGTAYEIAKYEENIMIFPIARLPDVENFFIWAGEIAAIEVVLVGKKTANIEIKKINDVKRYNTAVINEDVAHILLRSQGVGNYYIEQSTDIITTVSKLIHGKIDLIAHEKESLFWQLNYLGEDPDDYKVFYSIGEVSLYFAFNKNAPQDLVNDFKIAFDKVKESLDI